MHQMPLSLEGVVKCGHALLEYKAKKSKKRPLSLLVPDEINSEGHQGQRLQELEEDLQLAGEVVTI